MDKRWPRIISNTEMWKDTGEPIILRIRIRKWKRIGHSLGQAGESTEKQALVWNPHAARRRRPNKIWTGAVLQEAGKCGKACSEFERFAGNRIRWRCFTNALPY
jgi:hypothetical protein